MVIEKGVRNNCFYTTPHGELSLGIFGEKVFYDLNQNGGNINAEIFVDGKYFATSTELAWAGKSALSITGVELTTSNKSVGIFAFDDISLAKDMLTNKP